MLPPRARRTDAAALVTSTLLALLTLSSYASLRPTILSYFFLALTLRVLLAPERREAASHSGQERNRLVLLGPLFVLWVNLDRWFWLGPSLVLLFYVQRGAVPEKPIGELKNGFGMDRLSFHGFRANGLKLLEHTLAYALVVLHREAVAAVAEVAKAEVSTLRQKFVESRCSGQEQRASDLVSLFRDVAASALVCSGLSGGV